MLSCQLYDTTEYTTGDRKPFHFIHMHTIIGIFSFLMDLIFLPRCVACSRGGTTHLCAECLGSIPPANSLGLPRETGALFDYKDPRIRAAVWTLKYRGIKKLAEPLGELLYEELLDMMGEKMMWRECGKLMVVPIPLTGRRLWQRGFNQSALLARAIARSDENLFVFSADALVRIKNVPPQTEMSSRAERLKNLRGVFSIATPEMINGKSVVVVDDVTTTGATFAEARRVLLKSGAREVFCLAVAH